MNQNAYFYESLLMFVSIIDDHQVGENEESLGSLFLDGSVERHQRPLDSSTQRRAYGTGVKFVVIMLTTMTKPMIP